ncbi:MAG: acetate--CoA ligase family protein, partial [Alphaproteobacteria bacterium]|nr:acetate--CoA ligase family protein [Alphaproteobacteria bacterium]
MNIHEYQAKQLMAKFGIAVPRGGVAYTADEAVKVAEELGGSIWVVKSQIHAGGRGAGRFKDGDPDQGGVRLAKSSADVKAAAEAMLGQVLVTKQTGDDGKEVKRIYIEEGCDIARELYLSLLVDRASSHITIMASTEGGMDIEDVAHNTPEKILLIDIDPATGIMPFHTRKIAFGLGLEGSQIKSCAKFLNGMYKAFVDLDASMVEI